MTINFLIKKAKKYIENFDEEIFLKAYKFAEQAHGEQKRKSGDPYIIHPLATANILLEMHVDEDTLIVAILHDVPEDTNRTLEDIERVFGNKIAFLVQGITKLAKVHYRHDMEERQIESLKKLLLHSAKDIRVILIKLADRLHNMQTLEHIPELEKRLRIAKESFEIYVPIANLLGIGEIKRQMEDLCFKFLYPNIYNDLSTLVKQYEKKLKEILEQTKTAIKHHLKKQKIKSKLDGRQKSLYSIYQKMKLTNKSLPEIEDILALRIITLSQDDCYKVLGIIHSLFRPKPGKVQDYIAVPKANGYQSLHTTVFGINGVSTEFQIRTKKMHLEAEYGIAAHYFYEQERKIGLARDENMQKKAWCVQKILILQKKLKSNEEFINNLKLDIFKDRIFTFTPKGDVIDLPKGSTGIDFAYAIHTDIGHKAVKAEVNGVLRSLKDPLQTGETVKIITDAKQAKPHREWLNFAQSTLAKNKIKEWFKKENQEEKIKLGKELLQKELNKIGKDIDLDLIGNRKTKDLLTEFHKTDIDDLFTSIAEGIFDPKVVIKSLYPQKKSSQVIGSVLKKHTGAPEETHYEVGLKIRTHDRIGMLKDVLKIIADLNINILRIKTVSDLKKEIGTSYIYVEVKSYDELSKLFEYIESCEDVIEVKRIYTTRKTLFIVWSLLSVLIWGGHPFLIKYFAQNIMHFMFSYVGIFMLFFLIIILKQIVKRTFPFITHILYFWVASFLLLTFATLTILLEVVFYELEFNWVIIFGLIMVIYAYLTAEYIEYKQTHK